MADYNEDIEPIHELPADELDHVLEVTKEYLEFLWTHPKTETPERRGASIQVNYNLNTLIHSIKKGLLYFYPKREKELSEVVDANEAMWSLRIMDQSGTRSYPFYEGIEALMKLPAASSGVSPGDIILFAASGGEFDPERLKAAGIPQIRFHDLRHTYASLLLAQGENIKYVQNQLGHSSPTVTLNVYAHLMKKENQPLVGWKITSLVSVFV